MKTILVTGAAGFIGSTTVDTLLNLGYQVIGIDNFNDYYDVRQKHANLIQANKNSHFTLHTTDITDQAAIVEIFSQHHIDCVIHLAARAGVRPSLDNPLLYSRVNIIGTMHILEAMRQKNISKLVFASSSSVYGDRTSGPFSESDNTDAAVSPYGATKKAGEVIVHSYAHLYKFDSVCLRFFTAYGPRNRPDMACYKFLHACHTHQPITMYGDGTTGRDYTYIDDIVSGIISCLDVEFGYEILNLGNSSPILLKDMISAIASVTGITPAIQQLPMQPGDVQLTFADISQANQLIGYSPKTSFKSGIERLNQWYLNQN